MSQREIVKSVFRFIELRPVPYSLHGLQYNEGGMAQRLDEYYGSRAWRDLLQDSLDAQMVGFYKELYPDGRALDTFGVLLQRGAAHHVIRYPLTGPSLKGYQFPDPETLINWEELRQHFVASTRYRMCGIDAGLFERSWFLRGFENVMIDMVDNPGFYEELLDGILDVHLRFMDLIAARLPVEAYYGGDDVSDQRNVMMGLKRWRYFLKPRLAKLIAHAHDLGLPFVQHACGNVLPLIEDLIEIGLDGLESLQSEATDVFAVKQKARGRLVLIGGMGVQSTLFRGTSEEVRRDARRLLVELGEGGGYIIAPSKPLESEPVENAVAFIESVSHQ